MNEAKIQAKLCIYDIRQGFIHNNVRLLLPVGIGIIGPVLFYRIYTMVYKSISGATLLECAMYMLKGARYITPEQIESMYVLPAYWLGIQIVIGFLVGYYPVNDLHTYGQQVLIRSKKRRIWWLSKAVWNAVTVLYCYAAMYGCLFLMCKIFGIDISLTYNEEVFTGSILEMFPCTGTVRQVIIFTFIMPVIVSVAVSLLQMMLSIMTSPMIGFIVVQSLALLSTMIVSQVFVHNYGALAHTIIASPSDIKYSVGCVVCLALAVVSVIAGGAYFDRCNILAKE